MKVNLELENLEKIIEATLNENINNVIEERIKSNINKIVDSEIKDIINNKVQEALMKYVDDYLLETKITIGNSWKNEDVKEYTVDEYLKLEFNKILNNEVKIGTGYNQVTLESYIKNKLMGSLNIEKEIDKQIKKLSVNVNERMSNIFSEATHKMLTTNIVNILNSNETYNNMKKQISNIATGDEI